jgi:adenylate cyclase
MLMGAFVAGSLIHHFVSERQERWIKQAFSRYVSPNRVSYLVDRRDAMELGGRKQECSFVFTDLAGFSGLMESIDPADAVLILNAYLDEMIAIAFRHEGTLDRIVGDAVAIMFSAPVPQPDHCDRALACAMEMDEFACRYQESVGGRGIKLGKTRIGIHSGEVVVGNFGGKTIFDYRALGDVVNTAARLEGANKYLGTNICVSEATLSGSVSNVAVRPIGRLLLKGKTLVLQVFEPVARFRVDHYAPHEAYCSAYELMSGSDAGTPKQGDGRALDAFRRLKQEFPNDPLVALHLRRQLDGVHGDLIVMEGK